MNRVEWSTARNRSKTWLIVEGKDEKEGLLSHLLEAFPEVNIDFQNIITYETNIYALIRKIKKEYGEDWDQEDIDLPFLISNRKSDCPKMRKRDFTDIFLIFDYERHDVFFSETNIARMQKYFSQSEDVGKLYINYPMVESYLDLYSIPDKSYEYRKCSANMKKGDEYKQATSKTFIKCLISLPDKIQKYLVGQGIDKATCDTIVYKIKSCNTLDDIDSLLSKFQQGNNLKKSTCYLNHLISQFSFIKDGLSYNKYMRWIFQQIILHNIRKANKIQKGIYDFSPEEMGNCFKNIDLNEILRRQNILSDPAGKAEINVLNTSVFLIPDYNLNIIF